MQAIRSTKPHLHRVIKTTTAPRTMSLFAFPRFPQPDFAPLFSLMNEMASVSQPGRYRTSETYRSWTPKFSVRETETTYELAGELPGVDQKDINIEFESGNVLKISGRTESHHEEGTRPKAIEGKAQAAQITDGTNGKVHKATVEDEQSETTMSGGNPDAQPESQQELSATNEQSNYYFSERSIGEFARSFTFPPNSVKTEEVKASLKNGILSIVVPKMLQQQSSRRINIE